MERNDFINNAKTLNNMEIKCVYNMKDISIMFVLVETPLGIYLILKDRLCIEVKSSSVINMNECKYTNEDEACLNSYKQDHNMRLLDIHIAYNNIYSVPCLYFNITSLDGTLCSRHEIIELNDVSDKEHICSIEEHPYTGMPIWCLHPCEYNSRLKEMKGMSHCIFPLLSWLVYLLPTLQITIPCHIYKSLIDKVTT